MCKKESDNIKVRNVICLHRTIFVIPSSKVEFFLPWRFEELDRKMLKSRHDILFLIVSYQPMIQKIVDKQYQYSKELKYNFMKKYRLFWIAYVPTFCISNSSTGTILFSMLQEDKSVYTKVIPTFRCSGRLCFDMIVMHWKNPLSKIMLGCSPIIFKVYLIVNGENCK